MAPADIRRKADRLWRSSLPEDKDAAVILRFSADILEIGFRYENFLPGEVWIALCELRAFKSWPKPTL